MKQIKTITFLLSLTFSVFFTGQALSSYPESDPADAGDLLITERQVSDWKVGFKPIELQVSDTAGTVGLTPQRPVIYQPRELQVSDGRGGTVYQPEGQAYQVADHAALYERQLPQKEGEETSELLIEDGRGGTVYPSEDVAETETILYPQRPVIYQPRGLQVSDRGGTVGLIPQQPVINKQWLIGTIYQPNNEQGNDQVYEVSRLEPNWIIDQPNGSGD